MNKLKIAQVKLGYIEFEGLMDDKGEYFVAMSQIARLFSVSPNHVKRDLVRALQANFSSTKIKTEIDKKPIEVLPYLKLIDITKHYLSKGNSKAIEISNSLLGLSLKVLFDDAFGITTTKEQRQSFLKAQQASKNAHADYVNAGIYYLGWESKYDIAAAVGSLNMKLVNNTSLGDRETYTPEQLEKFSEKTAAMTNYFKSGYSLKESLDRVFSH